MAQFTIGLDLGHFAVKRVRLRSSFRAVELVDFQQVAVPQDERPLRERLAQALAGLEDWSPGDLVATALPGDEVTIRMLKLPFADRKRIAQTIGFELESQVPFHLEEVVFDYQTVGPGQDGGSMVMVALCPSERLGEWLEMLAAAGVDPRLLGADALAASSLGEWLLDSQQPDDCVAVLDIGHSLSSLLVLGHQGPRFARSLSGGGALVTRQLCQAFGIDAERAEEGKHRGLFVESKTRNATTPEQVPVSDAVRRGLAPLVREIRQSLAAHRSLSRQQPRCLWLCGAGARIDNLDSYLSDELAVPVQAIQPEQIELQGIDRLADADEATTPAWTKALGLALQAHMGGRRGWLNLRRGAYAFKGDFDLLRGKLIQVAVAVIILVILAAGNISVRWLSLSSGAATMQQRMNEITRTILGKSYQDIDVALSVMKEKISPATDPLPHVTAVDVLREIHQRIPDNVKARLKDINISPKRIQMTGFTDSFEAVEKIRSELEKYKCFSDIQTGKTQKTSKGDEVEFRFTIAFAC